MKPNLKVTLFYLFLIISWLTVFELKFFPPYIFPSPMMVAHRLLEIYQEGLFFPSVIATLSRVVVGFGLAASIGLIFGLGMGVSPGLNQSLKSFFLGLQTLPTVAWVPISLLIFGTKENASIYFVVVMSSTAAVAISTADGIANIPPLYLRAAQTLGTSKLAMAWRVILPAALPSIVTGIKLGWTMGWHGAVSGELIRSSLGLGFLLSMGRELNDISQVIGIMIITVLFGLLMDQCLFGVIERRIRLRWGLIRN